MVEEGQRPRGAGWVVALAVFALGAATACGGKGAAVAEQPGSGGRAGGSDTGGTGGRDIGNPGGSDAGGSGGIGPGGSDPGGGGGGGVSDGDAGIDAPSVTDGPVEAAVDAGPDAPFSFFVTSLAAMQRLSGSPIGFGGNLTFGETGAGAGLRGADKICATIAEQSMPGSGAKRWRAFLSTINGGPDGGPVDAIDRVGNGPWFDRLGRLVASDLTQLAMVRPGDADPIIKNDLPNEDGVPNHSANAAGCTGKSCPDNHNTLTGTGKDGRLYRNDPAYTCNDWTSAEPSGRPMCGHSWPRQGSGINWMYAIYEGGCAPGVTAADIVGRPDDDHTVGAGGGYGGIYCFALAP